jgi:hypothetical protein
MLVLKGLAEDVKLSTYGWQPITFLSFSFCLSFIIFLFFCSLNDISPVVFYETFLPFFFFFLFFFLLYIYMAGVVLCFLAQMFLHRSLGEYFHPIFFSHLVLYLYLYSDDNVSFKFGGREKYFPILLYIL